MRLKSLHETAHPYSAYALRLRWVNAKKQPGLPAHARAWPACAPEDRHVAETDGTPRYRKSKPPKGGATRNSRPSAKAKKRAALRDTLPAGSALSGEPNQVTPVPDAEAQELAQATSVVRTTMPKVICPDTPSEPPETRRTVARSTAPLPGPLPGPQPRLSRSPMNSTLRMELTVHKGEGQEPRIQVRNTTPGTPASHSVRPDARTVQTRGLPNGVTPPQQQHTQRSRKPTEPGFAPAFPDPSARPSEWRATERDPMPLDEPLPRGVNSFAPPARMSSTAPSFGATGSGNTARPRRPRRPGERTLVLSRKVKHGSKRDWLFVVMLVAALGLTASMFLSQQAPSEEVVDATAYDEPLDEVGQEQLAPTILRPWNQNQREPAQTPPEQRQSDINALSAREPSAATSGVQATELRSQPSGAEVLSGAAVVGSTPVRVARGSTDMVYVLRLAGHESKVVRVGPNSPNAILVELPPLAPQPAAAQPAAPSGTP